MKILQTLLDLLGKLGVIKRRKRKNPVKPELEKL